MIYENDQGSEGSVPVIKVLIFACNFRGIGCCFKISEMPPYFSEKNVKKGDAR
jgi:hypothetical protein